MSTVQGFAPAAVPPATSGKAECRVWERHSCELPSACQPLAARQDKDVSWQGQIRDISRGGLGLVLNRRFEPGTALVLELVFPGATEPQSLLIKVVHVRAMPGNQWVLGCSFLSRLSEERLQRMLGRDQAAQAPPPAPPKPAPTSPSASASPVVQDVTFEGTRRQDGLGNFRARRLHLGNRWPFTVGTILTLGLDGRPETTARVRIRVRTCSRRGPGWVIRYELAEKASPEVLRVLRRSGR
jgi:hypothetical protein